MNNNEQLPVKSGLENIIVIASPIGRNRKQLYDPKIIIPEQKPWIKISPWVLLNPK